MLKMSKYIYLILFCTISFVSCGQTSNKNNGSNEYFKKAFYLRLDARNWEDREKMLQLQRRYLDTAIALGGSLQEANSLKVTSFEHSKKVDSAIHICNVMIKSAPSAMPWYFTRGKLYQKIKLDVLAKADFDIIKAHATNELNTFDTLQRKNLDAKFKYIMLVKQIGEQALAEQLFKKALDRFPEDKSLEQTKHVIFQQQQSQTGPVIKY